MRVSAGSDELCIPGSNKWLFRSSGLTYPLTSSRPIFRESDGTLAWDKTTLVLVEATAGGVRGLGYTYADTATARLIKDLLAGRCAGA